VQFAGRVASLSSAGPGIASAGRWHGNCLLSAPMPVRSPRLMSDPAAESASEDPGVRAEHPELDALGACGPALPDGSCADAWMRILDAYDTLHQAGIACPSEVHVLRQLRDRARQLLLTAQARRPVCWLVPATPRDVTACHLVAVSLLRQGSHARLWPWQAPVPGAGITVGANWRSLLHRPVQGGEDQDRLAASA